MHAGTGSGLTPRMLGQRFGDETVTLTADQIPHTHDVHVSAGNASAATPKNTGSHRRAPRRKIHQGTSNTEKNLDSNAALHAKVPVSR